MSKLIYRAPSNSVSGYKKLIEKTFNILNENFDLIFCSLDGSVADFNKPNKNKLDKNNFFEKELVTCTVPLDRYATLSDCLPDKDNISIFTMWESSALPKFPVKELNYCANKVIVPSKWNKEVFENSGVKNVHHCPMFVDDSLFYYKPKINLDRFVFSAGACSASETGNSKRKNFEIIFSAFTKAFKGVKDVQLNLKISNNDKKKIGQFLDDRIKFITNHMSDGEVCNFLSESDVFISSSKAEGWGFLQIESLAVGRPIITVDYGGVKDFCNKDNSFFIEYEEVLADGAWGKRGGLWAEVREESIIEQMKYCYEHKDEIRHNWQKYSQSVLPQFNLENYANNLISFL